jgi:hypothetical protein
MLIFLVFWLLKIGEREGALLLGEKFRSDDTIHTIIKNISDKIKLCAKLYSFHDRSIHVRYGIYRALIFIFYIK